MLLNLRSLVFYLGYILLTTWFGITGIILFGWQPYGIRRRYILLWNRLVIFWLKITCGVTYEVEGLKQLPAGPFVVLSNHQSQWETFYLQLIFQPLATIMKRELLNIPGFGWGLRLLKPIAIDRSNPRDAMRQMLGKGKHRIEEGISVLVFPEGTRNIEATKKYAKTIPLWVFHGANDDVVNPLYSVNMVDAILKNGGKPNFTLYAKDNHNSWDSAFAESELLPWLFSNIKH